jgi:hypothetical protein
MFAKVLESFFGCWHSHYSFPITVKRGRRSAAALVTGTYVVCLDCGKELPYDWQQMRIVGMDAERRPVPALATKEVG